MTTKSVDTLLKEKKIFQVVNPKLVQARPEMPVQSVIQIMQEKQSGYAVIAESNRVVGIFTERDVVMKVLNKDVDLNSPVSEFMTPDPFVLTPQDSVGAAMDLMGDKRFYHVPLVNDNGELVGILSVRTLIRFLAAFYPTEVYNLPPVPGQIMETPEGG